jgi:hypothetical protein
MSAPLCSCSFCLPTMVVSSSLSRHLGGHSLVNLTLRPRGVQYGPSYRAMGTVKNSGVANAWQSNIPNSYGGKPTLITLQEFAIQYGAANLEQEMRSSFTLKQMLTLA